MKKIHEEVVEIPLRLIHRGVFQPRELFDPEVMENTRRSIAEKGLLVPVVLREIKKDNALYRPDWEETHYELADGERRFRCCKDLGLKDIRAIIRDLSDLQMLDYAVSTNDSVPLNPIERAKVYHRLADEFGMSQDAIAKYYNLKQQQISEIVRLLELPGDLQDLTARAVISIRHARELLKIEDKGKIKDLAKEIVEKGITTREISRKVREIRGKDGKLRQDSGKISNKSSNFIENASNLTEKMIPNGIRSFLSREISKSAYFRLLNPGKAVFMTLFSAFFATGIAYGLYIWKPITALALGATCASIFIFEVLRKASK